MKNLLVLTTNITNKMKNIIGNRAVQQYCLIAMALAVASFALIMGANMDNSDSIQPSIQPKVDTNVDKKAEVSGALVPAKSYQVTVTCFSSKECHSAFCQRNAGKPRGLRVAVDQSNSTFGHHQFSKVYIPAYDKTYEIVPETATGTDVDIWMGDDYQSAKRCGYPTLLVNFIK